MKSSETFHYVRVSVEPRRLESVSRGEGGRLFPLLKVTEAFVVFIGPLLTKTRESQVTGFSRGTGEPSSRAGRDSETNSLSAGRGPSESRPQPTEEAW